MNSVNKSVSKSVFPAVHHPLRVPSALVGGGGPLVFDFFVDSVGGLDANDGLTELTPKQTIAAAMTLLSPGKNLGLARGSKWREQFSFAHASITVGVYGTGNVPIMECRDVAPASWTQPDIVLYPDVWSISWTRAQAASTGSAWVNLWENDEFVRAATSLADLQTNGGAFYENRTATTTTISVKSLTDPNSNGIVYEISRRAHGFRGHSVSLGFAAPANQQLQGPIEVVGAIEHYNGVSGGPGQTRQVLIKDGNVHRSVTEGNLSEDMLVSRTIPGRSGSGITAFRANATGFNHTIRRCLALQPGGVDRINQGGFYCHGSAPNERLDSFTIDQCIVRAASIVGDTLAMSVHNTYVSDPVLPGIGMSPTNVTMDILRVQIQELTVLSGIVGIRCLTVNPTITIDNTCVSVSGTGVTLRGLPTTTPVISRSAIIGIGGAITGIAGAGNDAALVINNSIVIATNGRPMNLLASPYVGDYNVFQGIGDSNPVFGFNALTYGGLTNWQAATGQDANSVSLRGSDQTAGNANAFWLGVSTNANAGPADGDWRINPLARAYNAAGGTLTGTFADGVTPLTAAGPQEHWDYNTRSVVAGPPTRLVRIPETKAEERTYINDPTAWNFYP